MSARADSTTSGLVLSSVGDFQKHNEKYSQGQSLRSKCVAPLTIFLLCYTITADGLNQVPEGLSCPLGGYGESQRGNPSQGIKKPTSQHYLQSGWIFVIMALVVRIAVLATNTKRGISSIYSPVGLL